MTAPSTDPRVGEWFIFTNALGRAIPARCTDAEWDNWDAPGVWGGVPPPGWTLGPRLDDLMRDREQLCAIRNEIFYFMVRNVDQRGAKSYALLGSIKERLTEHLNDDSGIAREEGR